MHASKAMVGRVQGLKCRDGPLLRSDRRPTWGVQGSAEGLPLDEKAVYTEYTSARPQNPRLVPGWIHWIPALLNRHA